MEIQGFDWDKGNLTKNFEKHGVTLQEVEEVFLSEPFIFDDGKHSCQELRLIAFGITNKGRQLTIAFTFRYKESQILIRPISARDMHKKERVLYEKVIAQKKD